MVSVLRARRVLWTFSISMSSSSCTIFFMTGEVKKDKGNEGREAREGLDATKIESAWSALVPRNSFRFFSIGRTET